jgi:D-galactarolactone isomerase
LVIDHVGRFMPPVPADHAAHQTLCRLVDGGTTWVKLSAPYESSLQPITNDGGSGENHSDVLPLIDDLVDRCSGRLLWASNWPHPGQDPAPTAETLRTQQHRWLPTHELREQVLATNPADLYFG